MADDKKTEQDEMIYHVQLQGMGQCTVEEAIKVCNRLEIAIETTGEYEVIGMGTDLETFNMDISFIKTMPPPKRPKSQ